MGFTIGGNIFDDQIRVGIAIYFLIKNKDKKGCQIFYNAIEDYAKSEVKREYLKDNTLETLQFKNIKPDKDNNWINLVENNFEELLPLGNKQTKFSKKESERNAIFKLYTLGTVSNRDEWVYDYSKEELNKKVKYFIKNYNGDLIKYSKIVNADNVGDLLKDSPIKYTRDLKKYLVNGKTIKEVSEEYRECLYRVFCKKNIYFDSALNEMRYQTPSLFPVKDSKNLLIAVNISSKKFNVLASKYLVDLHFNGDSQCFALYYYDSNNNKRENITDWGLTKFQEYYKEKKIKKEDIFYYVYAVLHNPQYRKKYELNLKRDLPRIPLYDNFNKWSKWGVTSQIIPQVNS